MKYNMSLKKLYIIVITIAIAFSTFQISVLALNINSKNSRRINLPELIRFNDNWQKDLNLLKNSSGGLVGYGFQNTTVLKDSLNSKNAFRNILRINYAKGSVSPSYNKKQNVNGGLSAYINLKNKTSSSSALEYSIKFAPNFEFVKGGKLPGLCSDACLTGGEEVNNNGFSTRLMWRKDGDVEVYGYLPKDQSQLPNTIANPDKGLSIGRGRYRFNANRWYTIIQRITLNEVNKNNGQLVLHIRDDKGKMTKVMEYNNIKFVENSVNKIDKIVLSSFFGGNDESWASTNNTYLDIKNMKVTHRTN